MAEGLFVIDIGPDGSVAAHPRRTELPGLVAPVAKEDQKKKFNTLRQRLVAIACMGVPNGGFEFDSSFLNPSTEKKFTRFAELMKALQKQDKEKGRFPPVSVFGHADPTGKEDYNKHLSGRRGLSVYGLLTRNVKIWDSLFLNPHGGDKWGMRSIRFMLSKIKNSTTGEPFFTGDPESKEKDIDKQTKEAIKAFEEDRKIKGGGLGAFPSQKTRFKMYEEYMDLLCHDKEGKPFVLDPVEHFLARKKSPELRGDVQGCGEFNPVFLLSKAEEDLFASKKELEEARNGLYAKDRRVIIYAFKHDTVVTDLTRWPCPEARSSPGLCKIRFWSDAKERLERGEDRREFKDEQRTMACRFYQGFAQNSPCETGGRIWVIRFRVDGTGPLPVPLKKRRYVVIAGETESSAIIRGALDENGEVRIPVFDERSKMTMKLDVHGPEVEVDESGVPVKKSAEKDGTEKEGGQDAPPKDAAGEGGEGADAQSGFDSDRFEDEDKFLEITLDAGALVAATEDLGAKQRLFNLGFGGKAPETLTDDEVKRSVKAYRRTRNLSDSDSLEETKEPLESEHEKTDVPEPEVDEAPAPAASEGS